jgi:hypothetical protein
MSYAVVLSDRTDDVAGVLVIPDARREAEALALEMRQAEHKIEVRCGSERLTGGRPSPDTWS